jgi:hypothetical protein
VQSHLCQEMLGIFEKQNGRLACISFFQNTFLIRSFISCFFSIYPHDTRRVSWGKQSRGGSL